MKPPDDPHITARIQELRAALEQEFELRGSADHRKSALHDIEDLKGDMLEALRHTLRHSTSETLRARTAMWGYDKLLEQGKATADPVFDLLAGIPNPPSQDTEDSPAPKSKTSK